MSREHHSAIMTSFPESTSWQSVINKQPVKEMIMGKWKLSHWGSLLPFRQSTCDYEEEEANKNHEEKKFPLLYCCLVRINKKSGSVRLTGCLDNRLKPEVFICDEKFLLTACIRSSRSTDKDSNGSINQWGHLSFSKVLSQHSSGQFWSPPSLPLIREQQL